MMDKSLSEVNSCPLNLEVKEIETGQAETKDERDFYQLIGQRNKNVTEYWPDTFPQRSRSLTYALSHVCSYWNHLYSPPTLNPSTGPVSFIPDV